MGAGASAGVTEAIRGASKAELKSVLPGAGVDREKLLSVLSDSDSIAPESEEEARLRRIFDECDTDKSGDMDLDELTAALKRDEDMANEYGLSQIVRIGKDDIVAIFKEADDDLNGTLSWVEFRDMMTKLRSGQFDHIIQTRALSNLNTARGDQLDSVSKCPSLTDLVPSKRADVHDWYINYWELDQRDKLLILLQSIRDWGCLAELPIQSSTLSNFFSGVQGKYLDNPYHNFLHGLATLHYVYRLAETGEMKGNLEVPDRFALLVGALCHDCGHRGRNSAFEISTLSSLALRYNDRSPLENHHCATAFEVALGESSDASCNIFKNLDSDVFQRVRKRMVGGILATDMCLHNDHVKKLQSMTTPVEVCECDNGEFVIELLMHAADIGNPFMPPSISSRWGNCIAQEFTAQVEDELRLGLPVTTMMMGLSDPKKNAKSRVGFIDFVVTPLAVPLFALFPGLVEDVKKHLDENLEQEKAAAA